MTAWSSLQKKSWVADAVIFISNLAAEGKTQLGDYLSVVQIHIQFIWDLKLGFLTLFLGKGILLGQFHVSKS